MATAALWRCLLILPSGTSRRTAHPDKSVSSWDPSPVSAAQWSCYTAAHEETTGRGHPMHTHFSLQNDQSGSLLPANGGFSDSTGANGHVTHSGNVLLIPCWKCEKSLVFPRKSMWSFKRLLLRLPLRYLQMQMSEAERSDNLCLFTRLTPLFIFFSNCYFSGVYRCAALYAGVLYISETIALSGNPRRWSKLYVIFLYCATLVSEWKTKTIAEKRWSEDHKILTTQNITNKWLPTVHEQKQNSFARVLSELGRLWSAARLCVCYHLSHGHSVMGSNRNVQWLSALQQRSFPSLLSRGPVSLSSRYSTSNGF